MRGLMVAVVLVCTVSTVIEAEVIRCYACTWTLAATSTAAINCQNGVNIDQTNDYCDTNPNGQCTKTITLAANGVDYVGVKRGCDALCSQATTGSITTKCCQSKFCNGSTNLKMSTWVVLCGLLSALFRLNM